MAAGHAVTAFLRRDPEVCAHDGAPVPVARRVHGDIALPRLGLSHAEWMQLAAGHDALVHCAAMVRFDLTEDAYRAVNVEGARRIAELARTGGMRLIHVSTAYVCGGRDGFVREDDPLPTAGFTNGYEASKAAGERAVRASGARVAIARPSIVTGHSRTSAIRQFDTIYALFRLLAEGRVTQVPGRAEASFDFVPVDHVARGIAALLERFDQAEGGAYHLVADEPLALPDFVAAMRGYPQFAAPALVDPDRFDPAVLPPRERRFYARAVAPYAAYFARDPRFDDRHFRAVTGLGSPPAGKPYFRRLIDFAVSAGFLPQRTSG